MKFCPECGAKYDGSGRCRSCHTRFAPDTISEEEANELRLFRDFELERTEENGIRLLSCTNREIEFFVAPPTVAELGHSCFSGCSKLEVVDLSATALKEIPSYCFADCKELFSVILPSSLETIGPSAFAACESLDDIPLPDQLGGIDSSAFAGCSSLDTINLPSTLRCVRENAFRGCELLCEVNITDLAAFCTIEFENPEANPTFYAEDLTLCGETVEQLVLPATLKKTLPFSFVNCTSIESVHFPAPIEIDPLSFLGCCFIETLTTDRSSYYYRATEDCILSKDGKTLILAAADADIPASVTRISQGALAANTDREELCLSAGVTPERGAFFGCEQLVSLSMAPERVPNTPLVDLFEISTTHCWRVQSFHGKLPPLRELTLLEASTLHAGFLNEFTTVKKLTLPNTMECFPACVLRGVTLDSLHIPKGIAVIKPPFYSSCTKRLTVEAGSRYAIRGGCLVDTETATLLSSLGATAVPAGIRHIAAAAFMGNDAITVLRVPEGVERIDGSAFASCKSLRELYLPKSLKRLHGQIIHGSTALKVLSLADGRGFWSARLGYSVEYLRLDEGYALKTLREKGGAIGVIVKGHVPREKHYDIPDEDR